ncbi:37037_t:CDS:2, partial [Gigaspora margarita]
KDIIRHIFAERMIHRANKIVEFFKKSHKAAAILNQKILLHQISGGGLKTYIETRWTTVYECVSLIVRLKICLEEIQKNHSEIITLGWIYRKHQTQLNINRLEGLAKVYRFNLSNPIGQFHYTQATEVTPEIIINIAETVFKESLSNEQDLNLSISTFINLESSVFTSKNNHKSENFDETESDNNMQDEYNVDEIVAMQLELEYDSH